MGHSSSIVRLQFGNFFKVGRDENEGLFWVKILYIYIKKSPYWDSCISLSSRCLYTYILPRSYGSGWFTVLTYAKNSHQIIILLLSTAKTHKYCNLLSQNCSQPWWPYLADFWHSSSSRDIPASLAPSYQSACNSLHQGKGNWTRRTGRLKQ